MDYLNNHLFKLVKFLFYLIPVFLLTGNFLTNGILIISLPILIYICISQGGIYFFKNRNIYLILLFFLYLILSSLINGGLYSVKESFEYLRFLFFFLVFLFFLKKDKRFAENFIKFFLILLIFVIFDGIFQYIYGFNFLGYDKVVSHRISGIFGDELILGSFLSKYYFIIIIFFLYNKSKGLLYLFSILLIFLTFVSGERAAFVTTILLTILYFVKIFDKKRYIFSILILLFGGLVTVSFDTVVKERMIKNFFNEIQIKQILTEPKKINFISRDHNSHFQSAYLMYSKGEFKEKLLGRGLKSFRVNCGKPEFCDTEGGCCSTHPHNIFFQIISEIGLIGLFVYLYFNFYLLFNIFKSFINKHKLNHKIFLEITLIVILFPLITSGNIFGTFTSFNFYLILAYYIKEIYDV